MSLQDQLIENIFRLFNYFYKSVKNGGVRCLYVVEAAQYEGFEYKILKNKY